MTKIASQRHKVESEDSLRRTQYLEGIVGEGAKGGVTGAALGAGLKHFGHGGGPGIGAAAGTAIGAVHGALKGHERELRDEVSQQRMHHRAEERSKKAGNMMSRSYSEAVWGGFRNELEKSAFLGAMATSLGSKALGGITNALGSGAAGGVRNAVGTRLMGMAAKHPNMARDVGGVMMGAGALGAAKATGVL